MKDHIIICGYGYSGQKIAEELQKQEIDYIAIEKEKAVLDRLYAGEKVKYVGVVEGAIGRVLLGDAKNEEILKKAGIAEAKALLVTVSSDVEGAFISLMASTLNTSLTIVVKANKLESVDKLYQAGATKVISPSVIGGKMAAKAAIRPLVAELLDMITLTKDWEIAKVKVEKGSHFYHKKMEDLKLSEKRVSILGIYRGGNLMANPPADTKFQENDIGIVLGPSKEIRELAH